MSTQVCNTCAEGLECQDNLDRYSLQDDTYYYVLNCPPNVFCGIGSTLYLVCCDGTIQQQTFAAGLSVSQRNRLVSALISRCMMKLAFCDSTDGNGDDGDDGGNGDGTNGGPGTDVDNPLQLYGNRPQGFTTRCPDRLPFTYTVPAGLFYATTQAAADAAAYNFARTQAVTLRICLSGPSRLCCVDNPYLSKIQAAGGRGWLKWQIVSGSLPAGVSGTSITSNSLRISGIPTTTGTYPFTIRAVDTYGAYMQKATSIVVWGISDASLPDATAGDDYNFQLSVYGGTAPYTFTLSSGAFPVGIDMAGDGLITGNCSVAGTSDVYIKVTDAAGRFCIRHYEFEVTVNADVTVYWTMDEASGNRVDSVEGIILTPLTNPGTGLGRIDAAAGLFSNALYFHNSAGGSALPAMWMNTPATEMKHLGNGFSWVGWFKIMAAAALPAFNWSLEFSDATDTALVQLWLSSTLRFRWDDYDGTSGSSNFTASVGDWHFFHIYFDPADNKVKFQLDNGAVSASPVALNFPASDEGALYCFFTSGGTESYCDEFAVRCDRPFNTAELDYLYNSGSGRTWPLT